MVAISSCGSVNPFEESFSSTESHATSGIEEDNADVCLLSQEGIPDMLVPVYGFLPPVWQRRHRTSGGVSASDGGDRLAPGVHLNRNAGDLGLYRDDDDSSSDGAEEEGEDGVAVVNMTWADADPSQRASQQSWGQGQEDVHAPYVQVRGQSRIEAGSMLDRGSPPES